MRSYLTGSFLIARMEVRYSPLHYLLLVTQISINFESIIIDILHAN